MRFVAGCLGCLIVLLVWVPAEAGTLAPSSPGVAQLQPRPPIFIDGNAAFTPANGVVGGSGTPSDPYVIAGWEIDASTAHGIEILGTTASFVVRDVLVSGGGSTYSGVVFANLENGRIESVESQSNYIGILFASVASVTVSAVYVHGSYSNGVSVTGSSQVEISGSRLESSSVCLWIDRGMTVQVTANSIRSCYDIGFRIANSDGLRFEGNNVSNSPRAGFLNTVANGTVTGNEFYGNPQGMGTDFLVNMSFEGNRFLGSYMNSYVDLVHADGVAIVRNDFVSAPTAVSLLFSRNVTIDGNNLTDPTVGISADTSRDLTIRGNSIAAAGSGLILSGVERATLTDNRFRGPGVTLDGLLQYVNSHTIPPGNLVNDLPLIYRSRCTDLTLDGVPAGQLIVADCSRVQIGNLTIEDTDRGILLTHVVNTEVSNVTLSRLSVDGLKIFRSDQVTLRGVVASGFSRAAWIDASSNVTVEASRFESGSVGIFATSVAGLTVRESILTALEVGVRSRQGTDLVVEESVFQEDHEPISLDEHVGGIIRGNEIDRPIMGPVGGSVGIDFLYSRDVLVAGNNVSRHATGLALRWSTAVRVHHNRFVSNPIQATDSGAAENAWDDGYPGGGNVWSDYRGWDDCRGPAQDDCSARDGLGDIPYVIDADSQDHYPIVEVWMPNQLPSAVAEARPLKPVTNETVVFAGNGSTDADGWIVEYRWDFGDGAASFDAMTTHSYPVAGNYSVTLTVRDNRRGEDTTTVQIYVVTGTPLPPGVRLIPYTHWEGFRVPIPEGWSLTLNASVGEEPSDMLLEGIYNGTFANIVIDSGPDPTVLETQAYLASFVQSTMQDITASDPNAYLAEGPDYITVSSHSAVSFAIAYGGQRIKQRLVVIVSEPHDRYWFLIMTAESHVFADLNRMVDRMVEDFEITLVPPRESPALALVILGGAIGAAVAAAAIVAIALIRSRRRRTPSSPVPSSMPSVGLSGKVPPTDPCPRCGSPIEAGESFCIRCGADRQTGRPRAGPVEPPSGPPPPG